MIYNYSSSRTPLVKGTDISSAGMVVNNGNAAAGNIICVWQYLLKLNVQHLMTLKSHHILGYVHKTCMCAPKTSTKSFTVLLFVITPNMKQHTYPLAVK